MNAKMVRSVFLLLVVGCLSIHGQSGTFTVTTLYPSGPGSLAASILHANTNTGAQIVFAVQGTITVVSPLTIITNDLSIIGPSNGSLTINGGGTVPIFTIASGGTARLSNLNLVNGSTTFGGAAINNAGAMTVASCLFSNNIAGSAAGGAIKNAGTMTIASSVFAGNQASTGGAIQNVGDLTISDSQLVGNQAGNGGAVWNTGTMGMQRLTFSNNVASLGFGGGILNSGSLHISASTFFENEALGGNGQNGGGGGGGGGFGAGGAVFISDGDLAVTNCTFWGNQAIGGAGGIGTGGFTVNGGNGGGNSGGYAGVFGNGPAAGAGGNGGFGGGGGGGLSGLAYNLTIFPGGNGGFGGGNGGTGRSGGSGGSGFGGGLFFEGGNVFLVNDTIAGNSTAGGAGGNGSSQPGSEPASVGQGAGGGIYNLGGTVYLLNVIAASNSSSTSSPDLLGSFVSAGFNLIGNSLGATNLSPDDFQDVPPGLGPLQNNGGPTLTCALLTNSLAIGSGSILLGGPLIDQRGVLRGANSVDIGAFQTFSLPVIGIQPQGQMGFAGGTATFIVLAGGASPLYWQWMKSSAALNNDSRISVSTASTNVQGINYSITTSTLSISNLQATDAGTYSVRISNPSGTLTSSNAVLALGVPMMVQVRANPANEGNVSGSGFYATGATATVTATPNSCYGFVNWTRGGIEVSISPTYTFTVVNNDTLVANFSLDTVTTISSPSDGGTTSGGGTVSCGMSATVTASANPLYTFANWTSGGVVVSTSPVYTFTPTGNQTLTAHFAPLFLTVSSTNDNSAGSLRAALASATNGQSIMFSLATPATITLISGELVIAKSLTILGFDPNKLTINGNKASRVFHVMSGAAATIEGVTITNGVDGSSGQNSGGGGILNEGTNLTVSNCVVIGNSAHFGGGIMNYGSLTLTSSTLESNSADSSGGAIDNRGPLTIISCTIRSNWGGYFGGGIQNGSATAKISSSTLNGNWVSIAGSGSVAELYGPAGGGIYNAFGGKLQITTSTIVGNSAGTGGGIGNNGFDNGGAAVEINACTFKDNTATTGGCSIDNYNGGLGVGSVQIADTILKAGTSCHNLANDFGTVTSGGYNLSSDDGQGFLTAIADQINTDPMLGSLQDNGGPTSTCALLAGSPALDRGRRDAIIPALALNTDQRGFPRPAIFAAIPEPPGGDGSDVGSFEFQARAVGNGSLLLTGPQELPNRAFQFSFTNTPGASFTVLGTTNITQPVISWLVLGAPSEISSGRFQFTDPQARNSPRGFYRVISGAMVNIQPPYFSSQEDFGLPASGPLSFTFPDGTVITNGTDQLIAFLDFEATLADMQAVALVLSNSSAKVVGQIASLHELQIQMLDISQSSNLIMGLESIPNVLNVDPNLFPQFDMCSGNGVHGVDWSVANNLVVPSATPNNVVIGILDCFDSSIIPAGPKSSYSHGEVVEAFIKDSAGAALASSVVRVASTCDLDTHGILTAAAAFVSNNPGKRVVLNASMGAGSSRNIAEHKAWYAHFRFLAKALVQQFGDRVIIVKSGGNAPLTMPNNSQTAGCNFVAVGGLDQDDSTSATKTDFSMGGPGISVFAPACDITPDPHYLPEGFVGTSFAAPQVTGQLAALLAKYPSLSGCQVAAQLAHLAAVNNLRVFDGKQLDMLVSSQVTYVLSINTSGGAASGTVRASPSPPGLAYPAGTSVSLTAVPADGFVFVGWTGDAVGTGNPAVVTMNGNKSVTATFNNPKPWGGTWVGSWSQYNNPFGERIQSNITWVLQQSGNTVSGTYLKVITYSDLGDRPGKQYTGSLIGGTITGNTMTIQDDGDDVFTCTISGTTISGAGGDHLFTGPFTLQKN